MIISETNKRISLTLNQKRAELYNQEKNKYNNSQINDDQYMELVSQNLFILAKKHQV